MPLQPSNLRNALRNIADPDSGKDIVTAGMVKDIQSTGDDISPWKSNSMQKSLRFNKNA